jgi:hypothetical protein
LTNVGKSIAAVTINISANPPNFQLFIEAGSDLRRLQIPVELAQPLTIQGTGREESITVNMPVLPDLILRDCVVAFEGMQQFPEKEMDLQNAILMPNAAFMLNKLRLRGDISIVGGHAISARDVLFEANTLLTGASLNVQRSLNSQGLIRLRATHLELLAAADNLTLTLEEGGSLVIQRTTMPIRNLTVAGAGPVTIATRVLSAKLSAPDGFIDLSLAPTAEVEGRSTATVSLAAASRSTLTASPEGDFRVGRVVNAEGAEVVGVNVFQEGLSYTDLRALGRAERFVPYIPRSRMQARRALGSVMPQEDAPNKEEHPKRLQRLRRQHHWASTLADTLQTRESSVPGAIQSRARYLEFWSRRRSIEFGGEKCLLWLYSIVGYGESILRPLAWLLTLSVLTATLLLHPSPLRLLAGLHPVSAFCVIQDNWHAYWTMFVAIFLSPVTFFTRASLPDALRLPPNALWPVAVQVVALLLWVFLILAARRVTKAD